MCGGGHPGRLVQRTRRGERHQAPAEVNIIVLEVEDGWTCWERPAAARKRRLERGVLETQVKRLISVRNRAHQCIASLVYMLTVSPDLDHRVSQVDEGIM